jgi:hypothetical protein
MVSLKQQFFFCLKLLFIFKQNFTEKLDCNQKLAKKKLLYALLEFCENWSICRNLIIANYLEFTPQPCSSDSNVKCDICRKHVMLFLIKITFLMFKCNFFLLILITIYKRNVIDVVQKVVATVKSTRVPLTISKLCKVLQHSKEQQYLGKYFKGCRI